MEIRSKLAGIQSGNSICRRLCAPRSQSDRRAPAYIRQTFSRSNLRLLGAYFPLCSLFNWPRTPDNGSTFVRSRSSERARSRLIRVNSTLQPV
ncbi:hypothetical protein PUN28_004441 [Cardiocondyla obscurior]|uniref:Uncharacterized protein n=1 Tax=Cardiocondyla obscurior TaxID=286306 RepID=A0AAW2GDD6_9HYME